MNKKWMPQWSLAAIFAGTLFYYEILFRLFTVGGLWKIGTVYMLLLCAGYAGAGCLLSTLFRSQRANRICAAVCIAVPAVIFLAEYFVYRQFKILYDVSTVFAGASDAVSSYYREIFTLIFNWNSLFKIILFALPTVAYLIFGKRFASPRKANWQNRLVSIGISIVLLAGSILGIALTPALRAMCTTQYHFETAVSNLGLVTGTALDLGHICFDSEGSFETGLSVPPVTEPSAPTRSQETTEETTQETTEPQPVVYGLNQLDMDFSALEATGQIAKLNSYVSSLTASSQNEYTGLFKGKNLIFITAEAFSLEVIDPELTPTLYRLATQGIQFTDYYQPSGAGTTGGEYQNIFGMLPSNGGQSFKDTADNLNYYTIGSMLDREGYYGQAFHNNSYTYYSRDLTHNNIGYSAGFMGYGNGMEDYVKNTWPQSDLEMFTGTLPLYVENQPFNVYYMSVSGHSGYSKTGNSMTKKNWDHVAGLSFSDPVKGYFAAQLELEFSLAYLMEQLELYGIADNTVICLTADHFPYGLDDDASLGNMPYLSELYGYNVTNVFERDHSSLILWCGSLEEADPIVVDAPTSSLDILPTLANLFGVEFDSRLLPGRDVFSDAPALVFYTNYNWKTDYGTYYAASGNFVPADPSVTLPEDYVKTINAIVRNKIYYCSAALDNDYFGYLFG